MIKEFALEPEALASWESFRYLIEKFGVPKGRVISRFPKQWKRLVYEAAQRALHGTAQLARIEVRLNALRDDVLIPTGRPGGDAARSWLDRALTEHARAPFDGIIACTNAASQPIVMLHSDLDEQDARFQTTTQVEVQRSADCIVACAGFLLRHASTVKWIDHVVDLQKGRFQRPFCAALDVLTAQRRPVVFEIHRRFADDAERTALREQFQEAFNRLRVPGITFTLHLHPPEFMHDRFILTERGGLKVGHGLDDNEGGGNNPTANVLLLDRALFEVQWGRYSSTAGLVLRVVG